MAVIQRGADAALLQRLRGGDRSAWDELYRVHGARLYRFAYRLAGNPHDAADLVQETFARVVPRLAELDPEGVDVGAYLGRSLRNVFLHGVERGRRVEPRDEVPEPAGAAPLELDPERAALLGDQRDQVRQAVRRLASRQRLALTLCDVDGRSYAEIGRQLGIGENAVAQLVSRARQRLRAELRDVQVDRGPLDPACRERVPALSALIDGQLAPERREELLAHLAGCPACRAVHADLREAQRSYRALVPPILGLLAVDDARASTLPAEAAGAAASARARRRRRRALGGAGLALAILAGWVAAGGLATRPRLSAAAELPAVRVEPPQPLRAPERVRGGPAHPIVTASRGGQALPLPAAVDVAPHAIGQATPVAPRSTTPAVGSPESDAASPVGIGSPADDPPAPAATTTPPPPPPTTPADVPPPPPPPPPPGDEPEPPPTRGSGPPVIN